MPGPVTDPRAHVLRRRYHHAFGGTELPVPVEAIAEDLLGLLVEECDDPDCSGMLLPGERRLVVNATESDQRQRFTVAHELGHWVCQVLEGHVAPVYCRVDDLAEGADRTLEREANVFAAELLMPEFSVREAYTGDIAQCAVRFGVSKPAMHWRLYNLGLTGTQPMTD